MSDPHQQQYHDHYRAQHLDRLKSCNDTSPIGMIRQHPPW